MGSGTFGTITPIQWNFLSRQQNTKTQLSACPIKSTNEKVSTMDKNKIEIPTQVMSCWVALQLQVITRTPMRVGMPTTKMIPPMETIVPMTLTTMKMPRLSKMIAAAVLAPSMKPSPVMAVRIIVFSFSTSISAQIFAMQHSRKHRKQAKQVLPDLAALFLAELSKERIILMMVTIIAAKVSVPMWQTLSLLKATQKQLSETPQYQLAQAVATRKIAAYLKIRVMKMFMMIKKAMKTPSFVLSTRAFELTIMLVVNASTLAIQNTVNKILRKAVQTGTPYTPGFSVMKASDTLNNTIPCAILPQMQQRQREQRAMAMISTIADWYSCCVSRMMISAITNTQMSTIMPQTIYLGNLFMSNTYMAAMMMERAKQPITNPRYVVKTYWNFAIFVEASVLIVDMFQKLLL